MSILWSPLRARTWKSYETNIRGRRVPLSHITYPPTDICRASTFDSSSCAVESSPDYFLWNDIFRDCQCMSKSSLNVNHVSVFGLLDIIRRRGVWSTFGHFLDTAFNFVRDLRQVLQACRIILNLISIFLVDATL